MVAARRLIEGGLNVAVVESRSRVGGRLFSQSSQGSGLDLGATWFWSGEDRVQGLIAELGLRTHQQHLSGDALFHQPESAQRLDGNPIDVAAGRFTDGAQSLALALAASLPGGVIRLECPAHGIDDDEHGSLSVSVGGKAGAESVTARHVVLALPPALALHRISFRPGLPDRLVGLAAATPVWMGAIAKVVVVYPKPFWRSAGLSGAAISHVGPMREVHDMSGPDGSPAALFGFVPLQGRPAPPTEAEILVQLVNLFGSDAADPTNLWIADWRADEDTSPPNVEALTAYQTFGHGLYQQPAMDGRLHWASTETATVNPGHIEGAIVAAERAVSAVTSSSSQPTSGEP